MLCFAFVAGQSVAAQMPVPIVSTDARITVPVRSFLSLREERLIRQGWDISCGAAALSTLLTYELDRPFSEATISLSILANTDPEVVRARGGFSLYDLKRFAEAVGLEAVGYGGMALDDLNAADSAAIIPVRINGFDHFVVFRGQAAGRIAIGDPAFGNMVLSRWRFDEIWKSGIAFYVRDPGRPTRSVAMNGITLGVADLKSVYRLMLSRELNGTFVGVPGR